MTLDWVERVEWRFKLEKKISAATECLKYFYIYQQYDKSTLLIFNKYWFKLSPYLKREIKIIKKNATKNQIEQWCLKQKKTVKIWKSFFLDIFFVMCYSINIYEKIYILRRHFLIGSVSWAKYGYVHNKKKNWISQFLSQLSINNLYSLQLF